MIRVEIVRVLVFKFYKRLRGTLNKETEDPRVKPFL